MENDVFKYSSAHMWRCAMHNFKRRWKQHSNYSWIFGTLDFKRPPVAIWLMLAFFPCKIFFNLNKFQANSNEDKIPLVIAVQRLATENFKRVFCLHCFAKWKKLNICIHKNRPFHYFTFIQLNRVLIAEQFFALKKKLV